jgi:hypothetical protein
MIFLEETYQKLNNDKPQNADSEHVDSSPEEGQYFITIGTKNMVKKLPEADSPVNKKERIAGDLINPSKKSELMRDRNIDIPSDDTDDFIDLTQMI